MKFNGGVRFEGAGLLRWVQREEDGSVELVFDCKGRESIVAFDAAAWATVWKAAAILEAGGGNKNDSRTGPSSKDRVTVSNPFEDENKGACKLDYLSISTDDQPLRFSAEGYEDYDLAKDIPNILITNPGGGHSGIELGLNPKAAKELRDRLDKALEARAAVKTLVTPKTIPAPASAPV